MLIRVGFMTFAPEWLTGSPNLDTSNFMYLWVYLVFFNCLWVAFPLYAMWVSYVNIRDRFTGDGAVVEIEAKIAAAEARLQTVDASWAKLVARIDNAGELAKMDLSDVDREEVKRLQKRLH